MKMTAVTRKVRKMTPVFLLVFVVYAARRYWFDEEGKAPKLDSSPSLRRFPPPTSEPTGVWLLATSSDDKMCITLAASFKDWNIFLVLPGQTDVTHSRCRFLAMSQLDPDLRDAELSAVFGNSTSRLWLVIGIQHVIKYKPKAVYVAATENLENMDRPHHIDVSDIDRLVYSSEPQPALFPASRHFGCNLNTPISPSRHAVYKHCHVSLPVIQAPFVISYSGASDLYDFQNGKQYDISDLKCDTSAPSVVLQPGNYALVSLETGLFRYGYIWAAAIDMISTAANENRLLINLGVQKIIWRLGNRIKTFLDDKRFKKNVEKLSGNVQEWIELIDKWTCEDDWVQSCILHFMLYLRDKERLKHSTFRAVQKYLNSLDESGYEFPYLFSVGRQQGDLPCDRDALTFRPVHFQLEQAPRHLPVNNLKQIDRLHHVTCDVTDSKHRTTPPFSAPWLQFGDILLIVVFNKPHYEALPYAESLYSSFFPHLLFCGPGWPNKTEFPYLYDSNGLLNKTFLTYDRSPPGHVPGAFNYACLTKAINMQFNVAGYLVIADDTLLLVNNIKDFRRDMIWFLPGKEMRIGEITKLRECKLGMCDFFPHWAWWEDYQESTVSLLNYMEKEQEHSPLIYKCYQQLVQLNGGKLRPSGGYSDVYYIPQRLSNEFAQLSKLFLEYQVFLEIAVPTIIRCLEYPGDVVAMENKIIWDESRDAPWQYFTKHHLFAKAFYHPAKWGYLTAPETSPKLKDFYCDVIAFLHDRSERLPKDPKP